jgi:hypothetical protein
MADRPDCIRHWREIERPDDVPAKHNQDAD